jgi:hypothetical protein
MDRYTFALQAVISGQMPRLRASLARRFPGVPEALVEEAWQDALADAAADLDDGWFQQGFAHGGEEELSRCLYTSAWRHLRGAIRKVAHRRTARWDTGFELGDPYDPRRVASARAALDALRDGVDEAAQRFGRRREGTLRAALSSMLRAGEAVKPLADRYALPRRYLAEASQWLRQRLREGDDDGV